MNNGNSGTWIADGEKYALVGLNVQIDGNIPIGNITPSLWVLADTTFNMPTHWRESLGSIRVMELEQFDLVLLSKLPSSTPDARRPLAIV